MNSSLIIAFDINDKIVLNLANEINPFISRLKVGSQFFTSANQAIREESDYLLVDRLISQNFYPAKTIKIFQKK